MEEKGEFCIFDLQRWEWCLWQLLKFQQQCTVCITKIVETKEGRSQTYNEISESGQLHFAAEINFQLYLLCGLAWQGFQLTVELNTFDLFNYWQTQDGKTKESLIPFLLIYSRVGRLYNFISRLNETLTFICGEIKKDM